MKKLMYLLVIKSYKAKNLGKKLKIKRGHPLRFFDEYNQIVNAVTINRLENLNF